MSSSPSTNRQSEEPSFLGVLIGGLFRLLFFVIRKMFRFTGITIVWIAAFFIVGYNGPSWSPYLVISLACFSLFFAVSPLRFSRLKAVARQIAPVVSDIDRFRNRKMSAHGRAFAVQYGLADDDDMAAEISGTLRNTAGGLTEWQFGNLGLGWDEAKVRSHITGNVHVVSAFSAEVERTGANHYKALFSATEPRPLPPTEYSDTTTQHLLPEFVNIGTRSRLDSELGEVVEPAVIPLLGGHTILFGETGSGKGSVIWSMLLPLLPLIENGSVKLWGIDLKGGMELGFAIPLFDRLAYSVGDAETLITDMWDTMNERTNLIRGTVRKIDPSPEHPMYVLLIDEAATFKNVMPSKQYDGVMGKLKGILTQGRAPGFVVIAALQDPRAEAFAARDAFTRQIILRMASEAQTRLALKIDGSEGVPPAHAILESQQGTGFLRDVETRKTVRFRASYVSDGQLDIAAKRAESFRAGTEPAEPIPANE
jgi:hypothetical protein